MRFIPMTQGSSNYFRVFHTLSAQCFSGWAEISLLTNPTTLCNGKYEKICLNTFLTALQEVWRAAQGPLMPLVAFLPWTWMTLCSDWTAFSHGFWSSTEGESGSTWETKWSWRLEHIAHHPQYCRCTHTGITSIPNKALTQASEASQMAFRSCPPSRARTTRPPASDISCRVRKPKPGWIKNTNHTNTGWDNGRYTILSRYKWDQRNIMTPAVIFLNSLHLGVTPCSSKGCTLLCRCHSLHRVNTCIAAE